MMLIVFRTRPLKLSRTTLRALCWLFLCVAFFGSTLIDAQPVSVMRRPLKYSRPTEVLQEPSHLGRNSPAGVNSGLVWTVYSDRIDNPTYADPDSTSLQKEWLPFVQPLYVLEEGGVDGDYLHVVHDPHLTAFELSGYHTDYGWIHKSKVVLWEHSLVVERSRINRKALVLNTVDTFMGDDVVAGQQVQFQSAPKIGAPFTGERANLLSFWYVHKTVGDDRTGYALLGRHPSLRERTVGHTIAGWVPLNRLVRWDTRVAIEPNWHESAIRKRRAGRDARFFADLASAREYGQGRVPDARYTLWASDPLQDRPVGEWMRFPVLSPVADSSNIVAAGVMGRIVTSRGTSLDPASIALLTRRIDLLVTRARRINIVFVIDGSLSTRGHLRPIARGLARSIRQLKEQDSHRSNSERNRYRFGALVYRDWPEVAYGKLIELNVLTDDGASVLKFLSEMESFHRDDRDPGQALFYGMDQALRWSGFSPQETNAIVLVGGAGNHRRTAKEYPDDATAQVRPEGIVDLLSNLNCHLFAMQVRGTSKADKATRDDFLAQARKIMLGAAWRKVAELRQAYGAEVCPDPVIDHRGPVMSLRGATSGGWILSSDGDLAPSPEVVSERVTQFVAHLGDRTQELVRLLSGIATGRVPGDSQDGVDLSGDFATQFSDFEPGILDVLRLCGVPRDRIEDILTTEKFLLYTRGYTPTHVEGQAEPLFRPVLLVDRTELYRMLTRLDDLTRAASSSAARQSLKDAWVQMLRVFLGDIDREELEGMTIEEINNLIWGIPYASPLLRGMLLRDIHSRIRLPDDRFSEVLHLITEKRDSLAAIFQTDQYRYSFRSGESTYYWLPTDVIP